MCKAKNNIIFLFLVLLYGGISAQYTVLPGSANAGGFSLNELAQTTFINSSGQAQSMCYAVIECVEEGAANSFTLRTSNFTLAAGTSKLDYQSIVNAQVLSSSTVYYSFVQTGRLPDGKYNICISLYQTINQTALANQCISLNIASLSSVILISPFDGATLKTFFPDFFWTFPGELPDNKITYSIKVTELKSDQTYADAIQFNAPLIFQTDLQQPIFSYPSSAPVLNEDGKYVWQVSVEINKVPKVLSEIWMFQYKKDAVKKAQKKKEAVEQYPFLEKNTGSSTYVFADKINFRYKNECIDTVLNYKLFETGNNKKSVLLSTKPVKIKQGINYLSFKVDKEQFAKKDKNAVYMLEVLNTRNETWRLKFVIKKDKEKTKI